jgi:hypothetical protein
VHDVKYYQCPSIHAHAVARTCRSDGDSVRSAILRADAALCAATDLCLCTISSLSFGPISCTPCIFSVAVATVLEDEIRLFFPFFFC